MSLRGYVKKGRPALWTTMPGGSKPRVLNVRPQIAQEKRESKRADAFRKARIRDARRKLVRQVSDKQRGRNKAYKAVADVFKAFHPLCVCCGPIFSRPPRPTSDVHHQRGKLGPLLTDVRFFLPACRECHDWIGAHPSDARALGLLAQPGQRNRYEP